MFFLLCASHGAWNICSGKSGVRLDWKRRLRVVLGAAKGITYLHDPAHTSIQRILQGYLDPEYYMTQQLTEKSDV